MQKILICNDGCDDSTYTEKQLVHIKATTLLEKYKDGYKIVLGGDEE